MKRLLLAGLGLVVATGQVWAEPPTVAGGKERTQLEQVLYLPPLTPKLPTTAGPGKAATPSPSGSLAAGLRAWVVWAAIGPLSVSPLVPVDVW